MSITIIRAVFSRALDELCRVVRNSSKTDGPDNNIILLPLKRQLGITREILQTIQNQILSGKVEEAQALLTRMTELTLKEKVKIPSLDHLTEVICKINAKV